MRNATKRNEFRQLLLSDLDYSNYVHVVNSWLRTPQHSSFYTLTSKPSSSCSFPSSSTSPGVQNFTHFSLPSRLLLHGPSLRQSLLSSHTLLRSFESQRTVSLLGPPMLPCHPGSNFWEPSTQTLTHPSSLSFQTPSCREL